MLKGFKDFIMRGNVIDLAVAVVVGTAFSEIVKAFTDNIINPLIATIGADGDVKGLGILLGSNPETTFVNFGAVITAGIQFLIIAAVVYFILVMPMNRFKERMDAAKPAEEVPLTETELLTEIRDLLAGNAYRIEGETPIEPTAGTGTNA